MTENRGGEPTAFSEQIALTQDDGGDVTLVLVTMIMK